jgi:hypothetical protein
MNSLLYLMKVILLDCSILIRSYNPGIILLEQDLKYKLGISNRKNNLKVTNMKNIDE